MSLESRVATAVLMVCLGCGSDGAAGEDAGLVDAASVDAAVPSDANSIDASPDDAANLPDASTPDAGAPTFGGLVYESLANAIATDDLKRIAWHPSGSFALILGSAGELLRYDAATSALSLVANLESVADLEAERGGDFFLVVGKASDGDGRLWRIAVDGALALTVSEELVLDTGDPVTIEVSPDASQWAIGLLGATSTVSHLQIWQDGSGIISTTSYNANGGIRDLMWGDPALSAGSPNVIIGHGQNGADSRTYVVDTDTLDTNGWSNGFGNPGGAGWRPGGSFGVLAAATTNKLYVYNGTWLSPLPILPSPGTPQSIGWKDDGTRALIVGRATGITLSALVIDYRAADSTQFDEALLINASIPDFDQAPWLGNSSMFLFDIAWRPGSSCDEGIIVGSDNGSVLTPTFGLLARFRDADDPDCSAL